MIPSEDQPGRVNLARNLQNADRIEVYDKIMDAVSDFDMVNAKLAGILE